MILRFKNISSICLLLGGKLEAPSPVREDGLTLCVRFLHRIIPLRASILRGLSLVR